MEEAMKRLDAEWLELILMAKRMGLTIEEIREFLTRETVQRKAQ
ncbi:anti-repressor SinI family protein [Paenibacillus sp.]|nr:anti-repressor SinI family protein [Paenibacillus sp.]